MEDVIYFELNNWMPGKDYPNANPFTKWMSNDYKIVFNNEDFIKENKLCVVKSIVDMSQNYCITATKKWVEENCPELLTKYKKFIRKPDNEGESVLGRFCCPFLDYEENNIGLTWWEEEEEY